MNRVSELNKRLTAISDISRNIRLRDRALKRQKLKRQREQLLLQRYENAKKRCGPNASDLTIWLEMHMGELIRKEALQKNFLLDKVSKGGSWVGGVLPIPYKENLK